MIGLQAPGQNILSSRASRIPLCNPGLSESHDVQFGSNLSKFESQVIITVIPRSLCTQIKRAVLANNSVRYFLVKYAASANQSAHFVKTLL